MKAKNCLIFGGSGQIGRNLIRKLTKNNFKVTVVTRNIHQKSYIIKTQANAGYIDVVEANIFDEKKQIQINLLERSAHNKIEIVILLKIRTPPIVGVPDFFIIWFSGPSSLIGCPIG